MYAVCVEITAIPVRMKPQLMEQVLAEGKNVMVVVTPLVYSVLLLGTEEPKADTYIALALEKVKGQPGEDTERIMDILEGLRMVWKHQNREGVSIHFDPYEPERGSGRK